MGPGAGLHGGEIVAEGTLEQVLANTKSLTAAYLTGAKRIEVPKRRRPGNGFDLVLKVARANNLQNVPDRKGGVKGKSGSVRVVRGGHRIHKKQTQHRKI